MCGLKTNFIKQGFFNKDDAKTMKFKWSGKTWVTSFELQDHVATWKLKSTKFLNFIKKWKLRSTSYTFKSPSSNPRVQIHELPVQIHEVWVQIYEFWVQIHELVN